MRPSRPFVLVLAVGVACLSSARDAASVYARAKAAVVTIRTDRGSGTGFAIGDGSLVLTCLHVVRDAAWVRTDETGGSSVAVVGADAASDVALLRLSRPRRRRLELRPGPAPQPGTKVYAIGTSLGFLDHTISEGIVSGKRLAGDVAYLQITAAVSHGNSGSPVLDDQGRVVGMADFIIDQGQSLNFAVSSHNLAAASASIQARERVARAAAKKGNAEVVGLYAVALRTTPLYAAPGQNAAVLYRVSEGTSMVARTRPSEGWVPIVMKDRRLLYARAADVSVGSKALTAGMLRLGDSSVRTAPAVDPDVQSAGATISHLALTHKGTPCVEGGTSLDSGVGNGEFVSLLYAAEGYDLPATPAEQAKVGQPISRLEYLVQGDRLYLWDPAKKRIERAAVYIGGGNLAMADPVAGKVVTSYLTEKIRRVLVAARRGGPRKAAPTETEKGGDAPK